MENTLRAMQLLATLRSDLSQAMKARDSDKMRVIRALLSAIDNAGAVPAAESADAIGLYQGETPRRSVDLANARSILESEIGERKQAARQYLDSKAVARMHREVSLIESYLEVL